MVTGRVAALLALCTAAAGCALAARDHACWPYLAHQFHSRLPPEVTRILAHEHGTLKEVRRFHAPRGYYWRRRGTPAPDVREVRTFMGDYELARCPSAIIPGDDANPPALPPAP